MNMKFAHAQTYVVNSNSDVKSFSFFFWHGCVSISMPPKSKTSKRCRVSDKENEDTDFKPSKAKKKKTTCERFVKKSDEEMERLREGFVPRNTQKNTSWATKVFHEWLCSIRDCGSNLYVGMRVVEMF